MDEMNLTPVPLTFPLFAALLIVFCTNAYSEQSPKGAETPIKKEQIKSNNKDNGAKTIPKQSTNPASVPQSSVPAITRPIDSCNTNCSESKPDEDWWHKFRTDPVATFTGLLFFATLLLWWSTKNLVNEAKDTSKRQLRAYVVIDKCKIDRLDGIPNTLLVHITMKNCGQTPAHDVSCDIDILMDEMDKIISYTSKGTPIEQRESIHIVGTQSTFEIKKRLTLTKEGDFAKFNEGKFKIQIVTRIDYKDIFGDDQHFISTSISGDFFPSEGTGLLNSVGHWVLIPQRRGQNKAT